MCGEEGKELVQELGGNRVGIQGRGRGILFRDDVNVHDLSKSRAGLQKHQRT